MFMKNAFGMCLISTPNAQGRKGLEGVQMHKHEDVLNLIRTSELSQGCDLVSFHIGTGQGVRRGEKSSAVLLPLKI